jgi:hypothetical protein
MGEAPVPSMTPALLGEASVVVTAERHLQSVYT